MVIPLTIMWLILILVMIWSWQSQDFLYIQFYVEFNDTYSHGHFLSEGEKEVLIFFKYIFS